MTAAHLLDHAPYLPFADTATRSAPTRLPGLRPLAADRWLAVDADYAAQMAARRALIVSDRDTVVDCLTGTSEQATLELLAVATDHLDTKPNFQRDGNRMTTPDGESVELDQSEPLATLGRLAAEDFCLLQRAASDERYRLTAAVLCFPSSWRLADKLGQPLMEIHAPVPHYDTVLADRVERVFQNLRADRPAWRCNWLIHSVPDLHLKRQSGVNRRHGRWQDFYLRTERQTLVRLPQSQAVVFGIKTSICPLVALDKSQRDALRLAIGQVSAAAKLYTTDGGSYDEIARQLAAEKA